MKDIELSIFDQKRRIDSDELERFISGNKMYMDTILSGESAYADSLGWMDPDGWAGEEALSGIIAKANEVRESSNVFVLIGVGGSNQAARAAISAFQKSGPEILYAGNNLSPHYMNRLLEHLEGKSVFPLPWERAHGQPQALCKFSEMSGTRETPCFKKPMSPIILMGKA
jgi:glucose-6-phosphate isomerase